MIKLKPHEATAIARPLSRIVARHTKAQKILRFFTDPVLLVGTSGAVARNRITTIRLMQLGRLPMPEDPVADYEEALRAAEAATRTVQPTPDVAPAAAPTAAGSYTAPPAAAANAAPIDHSNKTHVPHEEPLLRNAVAQMFESVA